MKLLSRIYKALVYVTIYVENLGAIERFETFTSRKMHPGQIFTDVYMRGMYASRETSRDVSVGRKFTSPPPRQCVI